MVIVNNLQSEIINLINSLLEEWEIDRDEDIKLETKLIENLGFSSVDFVELFARIEEQLQQKLGFHQLIMKEDKYIDGLSIKELINFIEKSSGEKINLHSSINSISSNDTELSKIDLEKIRQFRQKIPQPPLINNHNISKNPSAVFLLCPSRSGSTLLRVMLAGNSQLFAPPELHLLIYNTLQSRYKALNNEQNKHLLNGTIRAIIQAKKCSITEAEKIMTDCESQNLTCQEFYGLLQQWIGNQILVDKTPSYAYHLNFLKYIENLFENALYLHLTRHPYGMIRSFEEAKMDQLLPFMQSQEFTRQQYGELAWLGCHQNIVTFLENIPNHRKIRIQFEDLVVSPEIITRKICNFLGVNFEETMLNPYENKQQKMTDGVKNSSRMSGDLKFHLHRQIEPNIAFRWRKFHQVDFLSDLTWELAESFGYDREN